MADHFVLLVKSTGYVFLQRCRLWSKSHVFQPFRSGIKYGGSPEETAVIAMRTGWSKEDI